MVRSRGPTLAVTCRTILYLSFPTVTYSPMTPAIGADEDDAEQERHDQRTAAHEPEPIPARVGNSVDSKMQRDGLQPVPGTGQAASLISRLRLAAH